MNESMFPALTDIDARLVVQRMMTARNTARPISAGFDDGVSRPRSSPATSSPASSSTAEVLRSRQDSRRAYLAKIRPHEAHSAVGSNASAPHFGHSTTFNIRPAMRTHLKYHLTDIFPI